jgi:hypothetical protein
MSSFVCVFAHSELLSWNLSKTGAYFRRPGSAMLDTLWATAGVFKRPFFTSALVEEVIELHLNRSRAARQVAETRQKC